MHEYFGIQLRKERKKLGLTMQVFSEACGTSRSYITLIENGKRLPGKNILPKIAVALKLKNSIVLGWYLEDIKAKMSRD